MTTLARSVNAGLSSLRGRLEDVRGRIARAAERSGRSADRVILVGATKRVPTAVVEEAVRLGLTDLGESRVQEAEARVAALGRATARWHLIGHLQRNKAGRAVELFDRIHSVDGPELAEALSRRARDAGRTVKILVEVNVSGEATKFGVAPEAVEPLLERVAGCAHLELDGLMTVGPPVDRPEAARPAFAQLRGLRDRAARALGLELPQLSMGMSGDYEIAIEEGATLVRVGTALFGPRA
jgi:pyridoxal phosphate enzyme (YggS family)